MDKLRILNQVRGYNLDKGQLFTMILFKFLEFSYVLVGAVWILVAFEGLILAMGQGL